MKGLRKVIIVLLFIIDIFVFIIMFMSSTNTYQAINIDNYTKHVSALDYLQSDSKNDNYILITEDSSENIWVEPAKNTNIKDEAIVFYPGAYVDAYAYLPIMYMLAEDGYLSCICSMSYNLAFFSTNSASNVINFEKYKDKLWYIGGHSLGGVAASSFYSKNYNSLNGLILFASYSTTNLSNTNGRVLSIYGSNDGVLSITSYEKNKSNLINLTEVVINGGNHANFASYGAQKGDNIASITNIEQYNQTKETIENFFLK